MCQVLYQEYPCTIILYKRHIVHYFKLFKATGIPCITVLRLVVMIKSGHHKWQKGLLRSDIKCATCRLEENTELKNAESRQW